MTTSHHRKLVRPRGRATLLTLFAALWLCPPAWGEPLPERAAQRVYAYTLEHQPAEEALAQIRPLLSENGTVEVQPGDNALVIRDRRPVIDRIIPVLEGFDRPPEDLRFDVKIVRAGPKGPVAATPEEADSGFAKLIARLRTHLAYEDYRLLARAEMTSREGEEVTYSLGQAYSVSFRLGSVMAGQRVRLKGFRIMKHVKNPANNKGRRLEPRELFHATLNLRVDQPFSLVLAEDTSHQEALMVMISCRREGPAHQEP